MTDELDKLRPEVRNAVRKMDFADLTSPEYVEWVVIRAELLRLAEDAAMFAHAVSLGQRYKQRAEHAEAELAALKARIAQSHTGTVRMAYDEDRTTGVWLDAMDVGAMVDLDGECVRLVVDEPAPAPEPGSLDELRIERGGSSHG